MEYSIANEIKSQTRVVGNIYAYDFIFLVLYAIGTFFFKSLVNKHLLIPYSIFSDRNMARSQLDVCNMGINPRSCQCNRRHIGQYN